MDWFRQKNDGSDVRVYHNSYNNMVSKAKRHGEPQEAHYWVRSLKLAKSNVCKARLYYIITCNIYLHLTYILFKWPYSESAFSSLHPRSLALLKESFEYQIRKWDQFFARNSTENGLDGMAFLWCLTLANLSRPVLEIFSLICETIANAVEEQGTI